ncbi:unnamed protein product [marine sediment metagenome]|uniref:Uncharacterized protein n=1 Tax=marine sediment metagenome TaxID=412755 RepID=X1FPV3_9ZZZZ
MKYISIIYNPDSKFEIRERCSYIRSLVLKELVDIYQKNNLTSPNNGLKLCPINTKENA